MSTKIKGIKYLDSNNYTKIVIREEKGNYKIDIKEDKLPYPTLPMKYKFSDELKEYNNEGKVISIINRFLDYTEVTSVSDHVIIPYYDSHFSIIKGYRELDLRLFNSKLKCVSKMVMDKYCRDRAIFCDDNTDITKIELYTSDKNTSYEKVEANFGNFLKFNLLSKDGKLPRFEKEFLEQFITEKLYLEGDEEAVVRQQTIYSSTQESWINLGLYLVCGNLSIAINSNSLLPVISRVVNKYNSANQKAKKMQIKMEGI